ncbi:tyrosine-protein phosphatase [Sphingobacterium endophyticum]|uniref:tyrosine-protein phosphatase n=1 Tax=Sphingobacterium endophyticum TaxID=2546448 RepID=UPI0012E190F6|nr:CpsB/CapC family capsule biosynthesis tyrosine phosphatase [Sphingobacterium endophyticum]
MGFWSNLFGANKKEQSAYHNRLEWIGWDIHNHILPGIDDGSPSVEDSVILIEGLKSLGIHNSISTPHVMAGVHNNTPETIKAAHNKLSDHLKANSIDFKLGFSAEYMIDDQIDQWISSDKLCLIADKYMLIEMSYLSESKALFSIIKAIQDRGYQPILAHPERYNYFHNNFKIFEEIKNAGCFLQLNLLSISKYYGENVKTCALTLIRAGMYDFVGTDMHHTRHLEALKGVVIKYDTKELLQGNPIKNYKLFESKREMKTA